MISIPSKDRDAIHKEANDLKFVVDIEWMQVKDKRRIFLRIWELCVSEKAVSVYAGELELPGEDEISPDWTARSQGIVRPPKRVRLANARLRGHEKPSIRKP